MKDQIRTIIEHYKAKQKYIKQVQFIKIKLKNKAFKKAKDET